ncbi:hypothetical protein Acr_11g0007610 [Actinidia rufa]|uniref:Uncharacterized protein n=1 Tax=Actinidia rufa TaxID=165716 RepID=A0A7J0FCP9_9ERIC|nr:hypothetical protein Acr_11g0007610 [Actinidia rufa]
MSVCCCSRTSSAKRRTLPRLDMMQILLNCWRCTLGFSEGVEAPQGRAAEVADSRPCGGQLVGGALHVVEFKYMRWIGREWEVGQTFR